jgi:uncharacterized protein DUF3644
VYSVKSELLSQSQDAALTATQVFNNPLVRFKSETFIVLMGIAWTYLLHAYFRSKKIEYRYFQKVGKRRHFDRTKEGAFKYWELARCISVRRCPLDTDTVKNLEFLLGLRNEIEHHMSPALDSFVSARYQACALNFNFYIKKLFGQKYGIDQYLAYSLQFAEFSEEQIAAPAEEDLPPNIRSYIAEFDSRLSEDEIKSQRFAYRMLFVPKLVGKVGQADRVVEFVRPGSPVADAVNREIVALKEVERPKFRASQIVKQLQGEGFPYFAMHWHTRLWQGLDGKNPAKGFGVDVAGYWYWYASWVEVVRKHCREHAARYS